MKKTKFWAIIISALFVISCIGASAVFLYHGTGNVVSVYHQGNLVKTIHLDTVTTPYSFTVESNHGNFNVITVEQGRICISEASCPDHVCIKTGWISNGAIPIVCLPNELVIQVESSDLNKVDSAVQ